MAENSELTAEVQYAREAVKAIERERDEKARAAADAVKAEYAERMEAANKRRAEAEQALRNYIDVTAAHPWDGKKVFKMEPVYSRSWSRKAQGEVRVDGIVEVVRQSSKFPENMGWSRPALGQAIVRKVKKDGSPSLQMHRAWGNIMDNWNLAE